MSAAPEEYRSLRSIPGGRLVSETTAEYDAEPAGFTKIQNRSVARHDISMHALALLVKLLRRRNGGSHLCCPSYEVLRQDCAHGGHMPSFRSIADWLKELALAREVAWTKSGRHSTYYFPGDPEFEAASAALVASLAAAAAAAVTTTATVVIGPNATETVAQDYRNGSAALPPLVAKQEEVNQTNLTRSSAPTERGAAQAPTPAAREDAPEKSASPSRPKRAPEAATAGDAASPEPGSAPAAPAKRTRGPKPSAEGFEAARWLIAQQGNPARKQHEILDDARAADEAIARLGDLEAAKEHALERLQTRRTHSLLLWLYVLNDLKMAAAAAERTNGASDATANGRTDAAGRYGRLQSLPGATAEQVRKHAEHERYARATMDALRANGTVRDSEAGDLPGMPF